MTSLWTAMSAVENGSLPSWAPFPVGADSLIILSVDVDVALQTRG